MRNLTGKTWFATSFGIFAGLLIFAIGTLFRNPTPMAPLQYSEELILSDATQVEVVEQVEIIQETDCVEIIEYNMNTGMKTTLGCIERN